MALPTQPKGSEEGTQAGGETKPHPMPAPGAAGLLLPEPLAPDLWPSGCPEGPGSGPQKESCMLRAPWRCVAFMPPGHRTL